MAKRAIPLGFDIEMVMANVKAGANIAKQMKQPIKAIKPMFFKKPLV